MNNNSTTPNHVQAVSPQESREGLIAAYELLRVEWIERAEKMNALESQLDDHLKAIKQIEETALPLAKLYMQLCDQAAPRLEVLRGFAFLGIAPELVLDIEITIPGVVTRFAPDEDVFPF